MIEYIAYAYILFCFLLGVYFLFKKINRPKHEAVQHYEKIRDEVTTQDGEKEEPEEPIEGTGASLVGFFIGIMVVIIIAASVVIPMITTTLNDTSVPLIGPELMGIIPFFIVLAILAMVIGLIGVLK